MINKLLMFFVNLMQKYLPDPFTIAWIITLVVCAMALGHYPYGPAQHRYPTGDRASSTFCAFAMQMTLVVITGYALAVPKSSMISSRPWCVFPRRRCRRSCSSPSSRWFCIS